MGLVERQPPRRPPLAARLQPVLRAAREGAPNLVAGRVLLARHLSVSRTTTHPLDQAAAEAPRHALARRQLGMRLGERPPHPPQR